MMATTHAVAGMLLATPLILQHPELTPVLLAAAFIGGIFPDFDVIAGTHRKTLHFPVYYWIPTVLFLSAGLLTGKTVLLGLGVFFLGAAQHSLSDVIGGGLERQPWKQTTDKAVYVHAKGGWEHPRHIIGYDGSPGDFIATVVMLIPLVFIHGASVPFAVPSAATLAIVAAGYVIIRKSLPKVEDFLWEHFPLLHPFLGGLHGQESGEDRPTKD